MDALAVTGTVIGVLVGLVALLEKLFGILPWNRGPRKAFEREFSRWRESGFEAIPDHPTTRYILGHAKRRHLDDERNAFALLCAVQNGDRAIPFFIGVNAKNPIAAERTLDFVNGRGIRVGWRAEYVLTQFDRSMTSLAFAQGMSDPGSSAALREAIIRIEAGQVTNHLARNAVGTDPKLSAYAKEVMGQLGISPP